MIPTLLYRIWMPFLFRPACLIPNPPYHPHCFSAVNCSFVTATSSDSAELHLKKVVADLHNQHHDLIKGHGSPIYHEANQLTMPFFVRTRLPQTPLSRLSR